MADTQYDYIVIGGGSGGIASARRAAGYGARTLLIEGGDLGGTCVNVGCVPKKVMWNAAHLHEGTRLARDYGFSIGEVGFEWAELKHRRDAYIERLNGIYDRNLENSGVDQVNGYARFTAPDTVEVNRQYYRAPHILVATGGRPWIPELPGAELGISSDSFFDLETLPARTLVVGSGYIATDLAGVLNALGSEVTLGIDYHHRLSVAETVSFCQRMPRGTLDFIEEPIRDESLPAYRSLRDMVDVPFALGEEFTSKWDFAPYVESGLANFGRIEICNAGGFTEAMKIAAMCETKYIDMMPHNPLSPICTAASIHYCAAIPNLSWLELMPYDGDSSDYDRIFNDRPQVSDNSFPVGDAPCLGIDVNEEAIKDLEFRFWEPPRLSRPDGSYTNW